MKILILWLGLLVCCVPLDSMPATSTGSAWAGDAGWTKTDAASVDRIVEDQLKSQKIVGASVGIIRDGQVVYLKGYGLADREANLPMTEDSLVRWASVSKTVTAFSAMQLVQAGKLSLEDDVRKHVPEFPDQQQLITVRDLMCHQSGIVHYRNGSVVKTQRTYDSPHPFEDVVTALDTFRESPLVHPPRTKYSYSTHAFILLSAVVERAGQERFAEQVQRRICEPLGLKSLQPDYQWVEIPNRAKGYRRVGPALVPSSNTDVSWKLGGGGFISNIRDMASWAAALCRKELLSEESYRTMWTPQVLANGSATDAGLGFFVKEQGDAMLISHDGSQEKARTRLVIRPATRTGVVVMCNSEHAKPGEISSALMKLLETTAP